MIHRIYSTLRSFKEISFRQGLNILLASKSEVATDKQTRNGAGKSSVVEIVHFLLGSKCDANSIFKVEILSESYFGMKFDLSDEVISVQRRGDTSNRVAVDPGDTSTWPHQPTADKKSGELILTNSEWSEVLGAKMFGIEPGGPKYSPTFRSIFPYFSLRVVSRTVALRHIIHFIRHPVLGSSRSAFLFCWIWIGTYREILTYLVIRNVR